MLTTIKGKHRTLELTLSLSLRYTPLNHTEKSKFKISSVTAYFSKYGYIHHKWHLCACSWINLKRLLLRLMHFQPTYLLVKPNNSYHFLHPTSCHCKKAYPQVPKKWEVLIAFFIFGERGGVRDVENF